MSMIFRFRMLSDESEEFLRDYEVRYDMQLTDLHFFICDELGYDESAMCSIFTSDSQWTKQREFTLFDMGEISQESRPMYGVALGNIVHKQKERLIFTYDFFAERSFYLELTGTFESEEGVEYPRTVKAVSEPPPQFAAGLFSDSDDAIFDEALGEFGNFTGNEFCRDEA